MIYELCIDTKSIEKYFDRYYQRISKRGPNQKARILKCNKTTPSIFLVNRQIFSEAVSLLSKQSITFAHGLLSLGDVTKVVSQNVLQQITSLTISVHGHKILQPNILRESWSGYMDLLTQLSALLAQGHNLKNLTIDLEDSDLAIHTTTCWAVGASAYKCDFRDHLAAAFDNLRAIRGVPRVTLKGFPAALAPELTARMQSSPPTFLTLPGEIRNQIYAHSASASDTTAALDAFMRSGVYPTLRTPTILLLNKQITREALQILRTKPLLLTFPATYDLPTQSRVPLITRFISATSLQQIEHLTLRLEKWEWIHSLPPLLTALGAKHNLKTFRFYLRDSLKAKLRGSRGLSG